MLTALTIVQVFVSIGIVALVLLQRGRGADAGAGLGAGKQSKIIMRIIMVYVKACEFRFFTVWDDI